MFRRMFAWGIALTLAAGSGCASQSSALRNENDQLRLQMAELKNERRRDRRKVRDLEKQIALARGGKARTSRSERRRDDYGLPVEVVEPDPRRAPAPQTTYADGEQGTVAYADDSVEIIYAGEAAEDATVRPSIKLYQTDRSEPAVAASAPPIEVDERLAVKSDVPPIPKPGPTKSERAATDGDPRALYKSYYDALRAGNHNFAIVGFRSFVERFPRHDYADNAQYWLGEAYYDQRDYRAALAEFLVVTDRYPKGNKAADAMLKTAFCYQQLGYSKKARDELSKLVAKHPKTTAAALANERLAALEPTN